MQATAIDIGSLSNPSKMPGRAYGLPVRACKLGAILAKLDDTVCSGCYAAEGNYTRFPAVGKAQEKRLSAIESNVELWADAMILKLRRLRDPEFRWHDSGEIQNPEHAAAIVRIAHEVPGMLFWLPTREVGMLKRALEIPGVVKPANLNIRVSGNRIGEVPSVPGGCTGSMVLADKDSAPDGVHPCPAPEQGGECGPCRACWDPAVPMVGYIAHGRKMLKLAKEWLAARVPIKPDAPRTPEQLELDVRRAVYGGYGRFQEEESDSQ